MRRLLKRNVVLLVGLTCTGAYGSSVQDVSTLSSSLETAAAADARAHPQWGTVERVRFFRDDRPEGGDLVEVVVTMNSPASYDAALHTVTSGFGIPVEECRTNLALSLVCQNGYADEIGTLTDVHCHMAHRPGGAYTSITFMIDGEGTYTARKVIHPSDASSRPQVTEIATGLALQILE